MEKWNDIDEQLPPPYVSVLAKYRNGDIVLDQFCKPCVFYRIYDGEEDLFSDEAGNMYDISEFKWWKHDD